MDPVLDCLVVGAGPGGLTAALYLARYRRRVLVLHDGLSRARLIPTSHNLTGFPDGIGGEDLLSRQQTHAIRYGATLARGRVEGLAAGADGFTAVVEGGALVRARRVILATGVVDIEPPLPNLADAIRRGLVRHCPICDGWESQGLTVAVIGHGESALAEARFLRTWNDRVSLLTLGQPMPLSAQDAKTLRADGIDPVHDPIARVREKDGRIDALETGSGMVHRFDVIYSALGTTVRCDLAKQAGAAVDEGDCIVTDAHQRCSLPGLWAVGDVVRGLDQIAVAMGHAAIAATGVHNSL